jgi:SAM-dependent methyltransferase
MNRSVEIKGKIQHPSEFERFEEIYLALRRSEQRLCSDEELKKLPVVDEGHVYKKEWETRAHSFRKLKKYFERKARPLTILEVGCGNGWLSNGLSGIDSVQVTGSDVNKEELRQAQRVFEGKKNLQFVCLDIRQEMPASQPFDVIVFAASIQYFQNLEEIIRAAFAILKKEGEIHILDSKFYSAAERVKAGQRSSGYFRSIGHGEMEGHYFHHSLDDLAQFNPGIIFDPHKLRSRVFERENPFHWIKINKTN